MQKSGVKMPEQKKRRPKSHLINSKEKLSKCFVHLLYLFHLSRRA
jgi:hypothetical protein